MGLENVNLNGVHVDTDSTTLKTPKMKFLLCFGVVSIVLLAGGDAASTGIEKANPTFDAIRSALSVRDDLSKISDLLDKASEELSEDFIIIANVNHSVDTPSLLRPTPLMNPS